MGMTTLEKVARAICVANGEDPEKMYPYVDPGSPTLQSFGVYQPQWFQVLPLARAALQALHDPTNEMLRITRPVMDGYEHKQTPLEAWQAMIHGILNEKAG